MADPQFRIFVQAAKIVVLARRHGAAIRVLARLFGESKSSMHRWLWLYEQIGTAALSQTGQNGDEKLNTINERCPIWDRAHEAEQRSELPRRVNLKPTEDAQADATITG